jgi:hypothetical protein
MHGQRIDLRLLILLLRLLPLLLLGRLAHRIDLRFEATDSVCGFSLGFLVRYWR